MAIDDTKVRIGRCEANECRNTIVNGQDVSTVFHIIVESRTQTVAEEVHIETVVLLEGLLPSHVRVIFGTFIGTLRCRAVLHTEQIGVCHTGITARRILGTLPKGCLVHVIGIGHKQESATTNLVVTNETPRSTKLQETDVLLDRLEERFIANDPSYRTSREGTKSLAGSEVLGTIVTKVELCHVAVVPVVGDTTYETNVCTGNIRIIA